MFGLIFFEEGRGASKKKKKNRLPLTSPPPLPFQTPFTVKMLTIHRWFDISNAKRDLKYEPLFSFEDGWRRTIEWFKNNKDEWHAAAQRTGKVSEAKKM